MKRNPKISTRCMIVCALGAWIALLSLPLTPLLADSLPQRWTHWQFDRTVELPPSDSPRLANIAVPQELYAHAGNSLQDIRVVDDRGAEVAFSLYTRAGFSSYIPVPAKRLETSFAPGAFTQVILDTGQYALFHNSLRLITAENEFLEWVQVDASDDAHLWRIVQPRAPVFRFRTENRGETLLVAYSDNNSRYLRVRILEPSKPFRVTGITVLRNAAEPPELLPLSVNPVSDSSAPTGQTAWRFDVASASYAPREVRFTVAPGEFSRNIDISASRDGSHWSHSRGEIYRFHRGDSVVEQLRVTIPAYLNGQYWRIAILNGNDAPLPGASIALLTTPHHVVFEQQSGRTYRLLYGQAEAKAPLYDLGRRLDTKQMSAATVATLGPEQLNSDYSDPRPWTEKHDFFLWIALAIAIALLAYASIQSLRKSVLSAN